ncbi:hypothetical protein BHE97_07310 [Aeromicrobium sp. PE09-221]|uniref:hypothetical protein n=1 Tax=Aeromicrobium sp. PE09-221 TaxID=1898043 RepID=UPI000B3EAA89|nr:hypothetical protein [Aeromicrobium sp. PE09-221]OUZ10557.1 hypothetical protein BHE97_07310 [Aeromicrobium sp. PE09-221]
MKLGLNAWIDESIHAPSADPGFYILATAISDSSRTERTRERLHMLVFTGQERLHSRNESPKRRVQIVDAIASTSLTHVIVLAEVEARRQE